MLIYFPPFGKVEVCKSKDMYSHSRAWAWKIDRHKKCDGVEGTKTVWYGSPELSELLTTSSRLHPIAPGGLLSCRPIHGWSNIIVPGKRCQIVGVVFSYTLILFSCIHFPWITLDVFQKFCSLSGSVYCLWDIGYYILQQFAESLDILPSAEFGVIVIIIIIVNIIINTSIRFEIYLRPLNQLCKNWNFTVCSN